MSAGAITLLVDDPGWRRTRGLTARLRQAAAAALRASGFKGKSQLTVLLGSDEKLKILNRDFRGKNKPTNVLSFPAAANPDGYRGDIAIAYGVTLQEARESGKRLADHASHLVVHGVLHLAGYDHEKNSDAKMMEPLEARILKRLGIADPYRASARKSVKRAVRPKDRQVVA
jgi:probable rRNA maturation factor